MRVCRQSDFSYALSAKVTWMFLGKHRKITSWCHWSCPEITFKKNVHTVNNKGLSPRKILHRYMHTYLVVAIKKIQDRSGEPGVMFSSQHLFLFGGGSAGVYSHAWHTLVLLPLCDLMEWWNSDVWKTLQINPSLSNFVVWFAAERLLFVLC